MTRSLHPFPPFAGVWTGDMGDKCSGTWVTLVRPGEVGRGMRTPWRELSTMYPVYNVNYVPGCSDEAAGGAALNWPDPVT